MRFIPTQIHGILDYLVGVALILIPFLLGFGNAGVEMWIPIIFGVGIIGYDFLTAWEAGVLPIITAPVHLWLDVAAGIVLAISPWLFSFSEAVWIPHLVVGIAILVAGLFTETTPDYESVAEAS